MYRVFNMGVGFVVIVDAADAQRTAATIEASGYRAMRIGSVTDATGVVKIGPAGLRGGLADGESFFEEL
jgi:phosphoribosylaminoimidazole (AIR) synthetase